MSKPNLALVQFHLDRAHDALESLIDDQPEGDDNEDAYNSLDDALGSVDEAIAAVLYAEDEF